MSIGLRIRGCRFDSCQGDFGHSALWVPTWVQEKPLAGDASSGATPLTGAVPDAQLAHPSFREDALDIHWGSFIVGVVATLVWGGLIALVVGIFKGGADDIF